MVHLFRRVCVAVDDSVGRDDHKGVWSRERKYHFEKFSLKKKKGTLQKVLNHVLDLHILLPSSQTVRYLKLVSYKSFLHFLGDFGFLSSCCEFTWRNCVTYKLFGHKNILLSGNLFCFRSRHF